MYFLGIDLGTSSVKILAINDNNEILGDTTKEYPVYFPQDKWAQQDPIDWWEQTVLAIKELIHNLSIPRNEVGAIGFSGQMHGLVALDGDNKVLTPAILWCDQRTKKECDEITDFFSQDKLSQLTGNKALTGFTAPKILWVKKNMPEVFAKIKHILLPKDYIRLMLTGDYATDMSDASGMLMLDVKNRQWAKEMLDFLEIKEEQLPKLYESYEVTGVVTESVKAELGLEGEILVVGGAGDQAAGAIGTGTVEEGIVSVTLGTSGVVFASHEAYAVDERNRLHSFCHANGKYHSMGVMLSAANCLKWWADLVQPNVDLETLLEEAAATEIGSKSLIFLPYLMGERTPYSDPDAKGSFVGMTATTTRGHMTRALLEGVAFGLYDSLKILEMLEVPIKQVRVIGGGAKSSLWKQILADVFSSEIQEINTNQGGALGAAILAAVGAQRYVTVEEGCQAMIKVVNKISPINKNVEKYKDIHTLYVELYGHLKEWFKKSSRI
ncbi:xylulokinase [Alkaliphilus metalliredigens QYMF]|uniref:Xylulose kinase n=1 Tax=Alkaliphilus metalliredigens (strain QYMF) TaxID=293826 RepID=A6TUP5_ALKMQ|nr:xylulokinase [Alkaliphilus metalliredigens]ABR49913.1 xylulokinase [Alkaliphilus metalliredigens QYMF]